MIDKLTSAGDGDTPAFTVAVGRRNGIAQVRPLSDGAILVSGKTPKDVFYSAHLRKQFAGLWQLDRNSVQLWRETQGARSTTESAARAGALDFVQREVASRVALWAVDHQDAVVRAQSHAACSELDAMDADIQSRLNQIAALEREVAELQRAQQQAELRLRALPPAEAPVDPATGSSDLWPLGDGVSPRCAPAPIR